MNKSDRFNLILSQLNQRKYLSVDELSRLVYMSPSTLRRDLAEMSRGGYLARSRGGVMALTPGEAEDTILHHGSAALSLSQAAMAQCAAEYLRDGDVAYLDASSLVLGMAPLLKNRRRLTLVANSLQWALSLPEGRHRLISLGGEMSARNLSLTGRQTALTAARFNYRIGFFSCSGVCNGRITCRDLSTAALLSCVLDRTEETILLCSRDKAARVTAVNAAPLARFTHIITDSPDAFKDLEERVIRV